MFHHPRRERIKENINKIKVLLKGSKKKRRKSGQKKEALVIDKFPCYFLSSHRTFHNRTSLWMKLHLGFKLSDRHPSMARKRGQHPSQILFHLGLGPPQRMHRLHQGNPLPLPHHRL
jgi:hypothetical protein